MKADDHLTLDELDRPAWGAPESQSYLVRTCHQLRKKPLGQMDAEDLRILIGQKIGLQYLLPYAIAMLEDDPLVSGDYYEGDLLVSVLGAVNGDRALRKLHNKALKGVVDSIEHADKSVREAVHGFLGNAA